MPERELSTIREPIMRGNAVADSVLLDKRASIVPRDMTGRPLVAATNENAAAVDYTALNAAIVQNASKTLEVAWNPYTNQVAVTSPEAPASFTGSGDPTLTLADIFRSIPFGNQNSPLQTGQALVPVTSTSGGSNLFLILLVVGIAGFGLWYYYKKKKGGD